MSEADETRKRKEHSHELVTGETTTEPAELNTTNATELPSSSEQAASETSTPDQKQNELLTEEEELAAADKLDEENNRFFAGTKTIQTWNEIIHQLTKRGLNCDNPEAAKELMKYFMTIPYMNEDMKRRVKLSFPKVSLSLFEEKPYNEASRGSLLAYLDLSPEFKRIYLGMDEASACKLLRHQVELLRQQVELGSFRRAIDRELDIVRMWEKNVKHIEKTLQQLARLSHAETLDHSVGTATQERLERYYLGDKPYDGAGGLPEAFAALKDAREKTNELLFDFWNPSEAPEASYDRLKFLASTWGEWIMKGENSPVEKKTPGDLTAKSVERLIKTTTEGRQPATECNDTDWYFPGIRADEEKCVQPTLMGLLKCVANCWKDIPGDSEWSPAKTKIRGSQSVPKHECRRKRIANICLDKPGKFLYFVFDDDIITLTIKVKPLCRRKQSWNSLDAESFEQISAHLSKYIYRCFNFYGVGASAHATGVTATLAYVSVHKLELEFGKRDSEDKIAGLDLRKGFKYPLMTHACFLKWVQGQRPNPKKKQKRPDFSDLQRDLYGEDHKKGVNEDGIPLGILLLWEIMAKRRSDLFGPDYQSLLGLKGKVLGIGSFSAVFEDNEECDCVLKIPTLAVDRFLVHEANILRKLSQEVATDRAGANPLALVSLRKEINHQFSLGGSTQFTKCLRLSPKGRPILRHFQGETNRENKICNLVEMSKELEEALNFIHGKKIVHLDVTPKNLIVVEREKKFHAVLVDFGCAAETAEELCGFIGTPQFSAGLVFKKYPGQPWHPKNFQDFVGLGLTLAALANCGECTWDMIAALRYYADQASIQEAIDTRIGSANKILESERNLPPEDRDRWSTWINSDNAE